MNAHEEREPATTELPEHNSLIRYLEKLDRRAARKRRLQAAGTRAFSKEIRYVTP